MQQISLLNQNGLQSYQVKMSETELMRAKEMRIKNKRDEFIQYINNIGEK